MASPAEHPRKDHTMGESATPRALAARLGQLRRALFGEHGAPELSRRLGIRTPTWLGYEAGGTVPAHVLVLLVEISAVDPIWLVSGRGPMFRPPGRMPIGDRLSTSADGDHDSGGDGTRTFLYHPDAWTIGVVLPRATKGVSERGKG